MRLLMLILLSSCCFACFVPKDGAINKSVVFCNDVFYLDNGIKITDSNITIDCAGAVIQGKYTGPGFLLENVSNISVQNCRIINFDSAFYVKNCSRVFLEHNHLIRNRVGVFFDGTSESAVYNYDVSLVNPIYVMDSSYNILSSANRFYDGDFCLSNFCNRPSTVIDSFALPHREFPAWFKGLFSVPLKDILFSGLTNW